MSAARAPTTTTTTADRRARTRARGVTLEVGSDGVLDILRWQITQKLEGLSIDDVAIRWTLGGIAIDLKGADEADAAELLARIQRR